MRPAIVLKSWYVDKGTNTNEPKITHLFVDIQKDEHADISWLKTEYELTDDKLEITDSMRYSQNDVAKYGTENVLKWIQEDRERLEDYGYTWIMLGVRAMALIIIDNIVLPIYSPGVWGIESDSDNEYIKNTALEQMDILRKMLKAFGINCEEECNQAESNIETLIDSTGYKFNTVH